MAASDILPQALWTRYFLETQEYEVRGTIMYQDNMSAMLLEQNGKASSGKRTCHINIRFFFIAYRVKKGELFIEHKPTEEMAGNFLIEPLQGAAFCRFRKELLNEE